MLRALLEAIAVDPRFDFEVLHCTRRFGGRPWVWNERPGRYRFRWLKGLTVGPFCFNPPIVGLCIREKFDLFVVNNFEQPTSQTAMAALAVLGRRWAIAGERPGLNPHSLARNVLRNAALWLPRMYADCAIGVGRLATQSFKTLFNDGRNCYSIPYLIDLEPFLSLQMPEPRLKEVNFLFIGQLIPRKGIDVLCAAAEKLFATGVSGRLSVVGNGPERFRIDRLREQFPERVGFQSFISFDERFKAYADAHVLVFPSRHDGWGAVVHEAMARGMPVITSNTVGATHDLIEDRRNGLIVKPNDAEDYCRAMLFFAQHPNEVAAFGARARAKAGEYTPQMGVETLATLLEHFCGSSTN